MHRLVVAGVADLGEPRMLPSTLGPRSATSGYSCARSLIPGFLRFAFLRPSFQQPRHPRIELMGTAT